MHTQLFTACILYNYTRAGGLFCTVYLYKLWKLSPKGYVWYELYSSRSSTIHHNGANTQIQCNHSKKPALNALCYACIYVSAAHSMMIMNPISPARLDEVEQDPGRMQGPLTLKFYPKGMSTMKLFHSHNDSLDIRQGSLSSDCAMIHLQQT